MFFHYKLATVYYKIKGNTNTVCAFCYDGYPLPIFEQKSDRATTLAQGEATVGIGASCPMNVA